MSSKVTSPFEDKSRLGPIPSEKGNTGGDFSGHNQPVVDHKNEGFPRKFYSGDGALKPSNSVKVNSPMSTMKGGSKK
jgi:hypothetical protein